MTLNSYMAYAAPGKFREMVRTLGAIPQCEVSPLKSRPCAVLLTAVDSPGEAARLERKLGALAALHCLIPAYAHSGCTI